MKLYELLIGKTVKIMTDMNVEVELKIAKIQNSSWTQQITSDTK
jgi:hypothetical protein